MFRDSSARFSPDDSNRAALQDDADLGFDNSGPSLPIILISAAFGIAGGVIGLYVTYTVLGWELPASVFVAVLCASAGLGISGAGLTVLTGTRAAMANIVMSCGLIVLSLVFLGLCMVVGALAATVIVIYGG
ncbi:MAG TPA: hypothetical protein DCL15_06425 [Chloroflexi bacterium]|nr:hypothetical protein [Chloroflexota bacterium]HHW88925.1 hypothetical protein [Chloroflexota bacterium]